MARQLTSKAQKRKGAVPVRMAAELERGTGTGRAPRRTLSSRPTGESLTGTCEVCGNQYDKTFEVRLDGATHRFDSFECAVQKLAPVCAHCRCRVIGHGVEQGGSIFCCAHCAKSSGMSEVRDRA